ncbi:MAG: hemolysin family protein [Flavobacteriales bacterium]
MSEFVLIIVIMLFFSAFFSGMEIAFISVSRLKVALDREQGSFAANLVSRLLRNKKKFISAMLIGNNVALVIYGIYMGEFIVTYLIEPSGIITESAGFTSLLIQTFISTVVVLVTAEFLPKTFFSLNPNKWLNIFAIPLTFFYWLLYPLAVFISWLSKSFIRLLVKDDIPNEELAFGNIDLNYYLSEFSVEEQQELDHEIQILQNALDFKDLKARDCQIPRNELITLNIEESVETLRHVFIDTGLSKVLIFRENVDNIIGYVHSSELFKKPEKVKNILRPVSIVPEPMPANEVLEYLIKEKRNLAVVVDEFGGTSGIITIEDIIEELFGEIEDEHDNEDFTEKMISETEFLFSARLEIDYLNHKYGIELPENDEYETLGGMVVHFLEEIPTQNSKVEMDKFTIEVLSVTNTKIEEVKVFINY